MISFFKEVTVGELFWRPTRFDWAGRLWPKFSYWSVNSSELWGSLDILIDNNKNVLCLPILYSFKKKNRRKSFKQYLLNRVYLWLDIYCCHHFPISQTANTTWPFSWLYISPRLTCDPLDLIWRPSFFNQFQDLALCVLNQIFLSYIIK